MILNKRSYLLILNFSRIHYHDPSLDICTIFNSYQGKHIEIYVTCYILSSPIVHHEIILKVEKENSSVNYGIGYLIFLIYILLYLFFI